MKRRGFLAGLFGAVAGTFVAPALTGSPERLTFEAVPLSASMGDFFDALAKNNEILADMPFVVKAEGHSTCTIKVMQSHDGITWVRTQLPSTEWRNRLAPTGGTNA